MIIIDVLVILIAFIFCLLLANLSNRRPVKTPWELWQLMEVGWRLNLTELDSTILNYYVIRGSSKDGRFNDVLLARSNDLDNTIQLAYKRAVKYGNT